MIVNAGIKRVFFVGDYPDELAVGFLKEGNIELVRVEI
jgi:deoxycytidylate deaminase